ncbi:hypothetical protein SUGI_1048090 [Cryptomeria japonica]|uniref:filament-like plant protein n=1 Tax=Cryptomeria japonica TaxID=3369 RepID=UPI002414CB1F|nr:filament-like plant protein [Cryptomeria japonica]GLJ49468.1 hypothetical protein SUGI_1048090 [Cryptomeria japonica]
MEHKNWPRRKKLEEKVLDVEEKPAIAIAKAPLNQEPVSGWDQAEMERLRDENAVLFASLQDLSESNRRAQLELRSMRNKLQASDKDKSRLQYELHLLNKQLQIRSQEKELSASHGDVEEDQCELFRGLTGKKSFNSNCRSVWTKGSVGSPDQDDNEDDISCAESWASALLSELDHFKPKQSQDLSVVSEILEVIQPLALHLQVDTARLVQAKEKVASLQDQALLHFLQELSSLLTSILSPGNALSSDPTPQRKLQLEIDKLRGQIEDLNKELQSQINQRQHLSALNDKLDKDLEAYRREKDACNINRCEKVTEDNKKLAEWRGAIEDLGKQVYEEKERCPWAEEEKKATLPCRVPLFRRLFFCASQS